VPGAKAKVWVFVAGVVSLLAYTRFASCQAADEMLTGMNPIKAGTAPVVGRRGSRSPAMRNYR
jgi:hypothetical protein